MASWERGSHTFYSCNYQNSLLLKLNMFDALIHVHSTLFNQTVVVFSDPFLASVHCLTLFYFTCHERGLKRQERHHLQDIVLIWQVSTKKEDYHKWVYAWICNLLKKEKSFFSPSFLYISNTSKYTFGNKLTFKYSHNLKPAPGKRVKSTDAYIL